MAKDERGTRRPANDNAAKHDAAAIPDGLRAALIPLVRLLARQAAHDWMQRVANDNASGSECEQPKRE
jgi:hypothetical protein